MDLSGFDLCRSVCFVLKKKTKQVERPVSASFNLLCLSITLLQKILNSVKKKSSDCQVNVRAGISFLIKNQILYNMLTLS